MGISLEKIEKEAPQLIDLAKKADVSLKKANLKQHRAKVALCLDISGSMSSLYSSGKIQQFAERILALGCQFDDDGAINIFLFGANSHDAGDMNLRNFQNFIGNLQQRYPLEGGTYYGKVIKTIRNYYFPGTVSEPTTGMFGGLFGRGGNQPQKEPIASSQPVYVMFVTDGASMDRQVTEEQLTRASYEPIFWQFMAIGSGNFAFLEGLDNLKNRYIDNADFFSVSNPLAFSDDKLYDKLMTEYPNWLKMAKSKGLLMD
ncbi:MAG: VWA domain-containing protein [Cyanobacteria bacterium SBLK]|nr:VWA domain-containing protein [Cyanobacteria bacterium SBLK]